jgi:hypothetical protein
MLTWGQKCHRGEHPLGICPQSSRAQWAELPLSECVRCAQRNAMAMATARQCAVRNGCATVAAAVRAVSASTAANATRHSRAPFGPIDSSGTGRPIRHVSRKVSGSMGQCRKTLRHCARARVCVHARAVAHRREGRVVELRKLAVVDERREVLKQPRVLRPACAHAPAPSSPVGPAADVGRNAPRPGGGMR